MDLPFFSFRYVLLYEDENKLSNIKFEREETLYCIWMQYLPTRERLRKTKSRILWQNVILNWNYSPYSRYL